MSASANSLLTSKKKQPIAKRRDRPAPAPKRDNTELLELAEELAHFGSWIWDVTKPRAVWSMELYRIFGIEPRREGLSMEEYQSFIHPDDAEEIGRRMQESLIKPILNQKTEVDYRIIRPDGLVRAIHSQRLIREVTDDGKLKVIVGVDQDVTEQRQALKALKKSEERFRVVAEAANVMVYEADVASGKIHFVHGVENLLGFKPSEIEHTLDWALTRIHPSDISTVEATLKASLTNPAKDKYSIEYRIRQKNGNYITVKDTAKAVKTSDGKTRCFIGGIRDITQRTRDREQIQQYSRHLEELVEQRTKQLISLERLAAIGEVAGMVGHDIRNPLQALTGEVYLIRSDLDSITDPAAKQSVTESLDSVDQDISYINKIVADLQDYSRKLNPETTQIDLTRLLSELLKTISIPQKIHLTLNVAPQTKLAADSTFLRRALTNLINNAVQAMPDGGNLAVAGAQTDNTTCITVADTGVGIPPDVQAKLFTPMFTTKAKGQGFGLAVVKRLIEAQGGTISFQSQPGKGTKFTVQLPTRAEA